MKIQELLEGLSGQQKAAEKMGKSQGDAGKPMMTKVQVEKSFGTGMWQIYSDAYEEGKNRYKSKDDHDAWKEKTAAKRQGRNFHE